MSFFLSYFLVLFVLYVVVIYLNRLWFKIAFKVVVIKSQQFLFLHSLKCPSHLDFISTPSLKISIIILSIFFQKKSSTFFNFSLNYLVYDYYCMTFMFLVTILLIIIILFISIILGFLPNHTLSIYCLF